MDKKYKAIPTIITKKPDTEYDFELQETRFVMIDTESGEIVDDAQGYGYRTAQKAYACWSYKNRDRSKDREKAKKERIIGRWLKEHEEFSYLLEDVGLEMYKLGGDDKLDAKLVKDLLKDSGYTDLPFSAGELLKYWNKVN